jgi:hypothetical protein
LPQRLASIGIGPEIIADKAREIPGFSPIIASFTADYGTSEPNCEILRVH